MAKKNAAKGKVAPKKATSNSTTNGAVQEEEAKAPEVVEEDVEMAAPEEVTEVEAAAPEVEEAKEDAVMAEPEEVTVVSGDESGEKPDEENAEEKTEEKTEETEEKKAPVKILAPKKAVPKIPEKPKEKELDDVPDGRAVHTHTVGFSNNDCTLNTIIGQGGLIVSSFQNDALQFLNATTRANVGVVAGRVYYEVEYLEQAVGTKNTSFRNHDVRIGFATEEAKLTAHANSFFFDQDGNFFAGGEKSRTNKKFEKKDVIGVLLNMVEGHDNCNTVSLFKNGVRQASMPIPASCLGKALFPVVSVKSATVLVNFGATPIWKPLPFKVTMLSKAADADVQLNPLAKARESERVAVLPIGIPGESYFDAADEILASGDFVEISSRAVVQWAEYTGYRRNKTGGSVNNPETGFSVKEFDAPDALKTQMLHLAFLLGRSVAIVDCKANLMSDKRAATLAALPQFVKKAYVAAGIPTEEFVAQQRELEIARLRALKKDGDEEEINEMSLPDDFMFRTHVVPELAERDLQSGFSKFSFPTSGEGFDEIIYTWSEEDLANQAFSDWATDRKATLKVTDIVPSAWFKEKLDAWLNCKLDWRRKHREYVDKRNKAKAEKERAKAEVAAKKAKKAREQKLEMEKKQREFAKKKAEQDKRRKTAEEKGEEFDEEEVVEEPFVVESDEEEEVPQEEEEEVEEVDVWNCDDINDADGLGNPLYANWELEDWTLINIRYEFHLLVHAFLNDVKDEQRKGIYKPHLPEYYDLYYKRQFFAPQYGCTDLDGLLEMLKDTMHVESKKSLVCAEHEIETPHSVFVKLTEEARRIRAAAIEAGDEGARLSFAQPTASAIRPNKDIKPKHNLGKPAAAAPARNNALPKSASKPAAKSASKQFSAYGANMSATDRLRDNLMRSSAAGRANFAAPAAVGFRGAYQPSPAMRGAYAPGPVAFKRPYDGNNGYGSDPKRARGNYGNNFRR